MTKPPKTEPPKTEPPEPGRKDASDASAVEQYLVKDPESLVVVLRVARRSESTCRRAGSG